MKYILVVSLCFFISLQADNISVFNKASKPVFIAPYTVNNSAWQVGNVNLVGPNQSAIVRRPKKRKGHDRQLAFSFVPGLLKPQFEKDVFYQEISSKNIGTTQGSTFYITQKKGKLTGYNAAQWNIEEPLKSGVKKVNKLTKGDLSLIRKNIAKQLKVVRENPYKNKVAHVRKGTNISPQEKEYLAKRLPKVKLALEKFLSMPLDGKYIPKIAFIGSGGGYRAMLWSLGATVGAQEIELLEAITYFVGLSGSTWFLGSWFASGLSITDFKEMIFGKLGKGFGRLWGLGTVPFLGLVPITNQEAKLMANNILLKFAMRQPITIVDFYGALLANRFFAEFGNKRQQVRLSGQRKIIKNGDLPFPIYTTVQVGRRTSNWFEFNPYEAGTMSSEVWTPSWAFNRVFKNGISQNFAPEQSLGYILGACGSAFAANFMQIYQEIASKLDNRAVKKIIDLILKGVGRRQLLNGARIYNNAFGLPGIATNNELILQLVDAGLAFNLPYPPISGQANGRKADILIFLDASETIYEAYQLKRVEQYARKNNLKFPKIDFTGLGKKTISVFKDEKDPSVPVVIYMPRSKESHMWDVYKDQSGFKHFAEFITNFDPERCIKTGFCSTGNFTYSTKQAKQLVALAEFNMSVSQETIKDAIKWVIENK